MMAMYPRSPSVATEDFFITPDSRSVYFSGREAGTTEPWSTNFDIYSVPMGGGPFTNLTAENKAWDASPRVSPDGKTLAYKAMKRPGFEADRFEIKLRDVAGKVATLAADWDRSVDDFAWSRDGRACSWWPVMWARTRLFKIDVSTGTVTALSKDGHIDAFHETPGASSFLKSGLNSPSQLYLSKPGGVIDMAPSTSPP
jgi:dipeptidyl aminopeptidase/acylaminoacyl peptidase